VAKIEVAGNTALATILNYEQGVAPAEEDGEVVGLAEKTEALDAALTINGIDIVSGSNTVENALDGVTLNLLAPTEAGAPLTLKVQADNETAKKAIEAFVAGYNSLQAVIRQLTAYSAENNTASALTGDRVARSVQTQVRGVLAEGVDNGGFAVLAQLGITTDVTTGALSIDQDKFAEALKNNADDIALLFTGENGLAKKLDKVIDDITADDGLLQTATKGVEASIKDLDKQYERMQTRIDDTIERYRAQFVALDKYMTQMNGISSYLTQQLNLLGGQKKD